MSRIHVLDPVVADRIAAGEVVERPASVVKELVDNALDAGARRIDVAIDQGGLERLVVDDDGGGMDREDVGLAVKRHATSKLSRLEDLDHLSSLGFRGEALAAIGAVSRLVLESRRADDPHGWRIEVRHGDEGPVTAVARAPGTRVTVTELFQTVPARLKALKSPGAEQAQIHQLMTQMAAAYPTVAVRYLADGETVFATAGDGRAVDTIGLLWGSEVAEQLLPVRAEALGGTVHVSGFVAPPGMARANRTAQVVVVNGRLVKNLSLRLAAEHAYGPALGERRYPLFWLWITLPPDEVDPNAHPAKAEVRLQRERAVAGHVYAGVAEALRTATAFPLQAEAPAALPSAASQLTFGSTPMAHEERARPVLHQEIAMLVPLAQWAERYILAQGPEGLYLIDQHAAHERVYYDRLRRAAETVSTSQPLLFPLSLTLSATEWAVWQRDRDVLRAAGFDFEEVGGTTLAVRAVPAALAEDAGMASVHWVIESLADDRPDRRHPVAWAKDHRLAMAACKAAVKASRSLSRPEMEALILAMAESEAPRSCPHGRPTLLVLGLGEVDRRFGR